MSRKDSARKSLTSLASSSSAKYDAFTAQERIKELEHQVSDLKHRLDELRKAKNQTIIKKDKEYVPVGGISQVQRRASQTEDKNKDKKASETIRQQERQIKEKEVEMEKLKSTIERQKLEMETLRNKHEEFVKTSEIDQSTQIKELERLKSEIDAVKKENKELAKKRTEKQDATEELEKLHTENAHLRQISERLELRNEELRCRIDDLLEELSRKEAQWCEREEKFKLELKASWGERYHEWMVKTEAKINELQEANNFLKHLLEKERRDDT